LLENDRVDLQVVVELLEIAKTRTAMHGGSVEVMSTDSQDDFDIGCEGVNER
jgi:hypothetical protein